MFSLDEAAVAYATAAEHLLGADTSFLNANQAVIPIFVSMLFQSLEISIKHAGVSSGLFTMAEARCKQHRSGHGIKELATLAGERLGGEPFEPLVMAMTYSNLSDDRSSQFIRKMICGDELSKTRDSYASRQLGYGEVSDGDFSLISPIPEWIKAVKQTAINLPSTIDILSQWRKSESKAKHFAIWVENK